MLYCRAPSPLGLETETSERFRSKICKVDSRIYEETRQHHSSIHPRDYHLRECQHFLSVDYQLTLLIQAPLSLIAAIFNLRIVEFPVDLHLRYVFIYMFGISLAIILPMVLLVIYTTRHSIAKIPIRLGKRVVNCNWLVEIRRERQKRNFKRQLEEKDKYYASSSGFFSKKEQAEKRVPFWRKQVEKKVVDSEMGFA
jgi:hypothetical protein